MFEEQKNRLAASQIGINLTGSHPNPPPNSEHCQSCQAPGHHPRSRQSSQSQMQCDSVTSKQLSKIIEYLAEIKLFLGPSTKPDESSASHSPTTNPINVENEVLTEKPATTAHDVPANVSLASIEEFIPDLPVQPSLNCQLQTNQL